MHASIIGQPVAPLICGIYEQLAVTLKTLARHGGYDASLPLPAQDFLAATLGTLGEWLGYRAVDARYM